MDLAFMNNGSTYRPVLIVGYCDCLIMKDRILLFVVVYDWICVRLLAKA